MEMLLEALVNLFTWSHLFFLFLGTMLGLVVGVLPGLGGIAGLSLVLPFGFGMDPTDALAMMIGLLAPTTTSDTFPAVLMGIPGTAGSQATVMDGFPLAKQGQAARALSAAFGASLFGGLFGAVVLTGAIFVAEPVILAIGFGEQMLLVVLALSMIGMLTGNHVFKGLATCGIGLLLGVVGVAPGTGEFRLDFGSIYLSSGIPIVIIGMGMFAMPEIIELLRRQGTISETGTLGVGWIQGLKDVFRHRWIALRTAGIGCLVGALPGLGGSVVDWIAYGHVIQTTRNRERYGTGDIRGVIAPEAANNAKEGGALIPTLMFGIPGSGSMAILLGGLVLVGIEPGLSMVQDHLDLTYTIIWSLALANVIGAGTCILLAQPISRLTTIQYALLAPIMLVLIFFAAFQSSRDWGDLIALFVVGTLGVYMKRFGWPRPALLIGYFLSTQLEASTYQAIQIYGASFLERPVVIGLLVLTALSVYAAARFTPHKPQPTANGPHRARNVGPQLVLTAVFVAGPLLVLVDSVGRPFLAQMFPITVSLLTLALLAPVVYGQLRYRTANGVFYDSEVGEKSNRSDLHYLLWILAMVAGVAIVGYPLTTAAFVFAFTTAKTRGSLWRNAVLALACVAFLGVMSYFLTLKYPQGLLQDFLPMPWWLGG